MGAYIINIPDTVDRIIYVNVGPDSGRTYISSHRVEDLTPYTEPDLEQVRKEAYEAGAKSSAIVIADDKAHEAYQRGLNDAWECARKICLGVSEGGMNEKVLCDIFAVEYYRDAMKDYSASDAVEKIRQYEQEKEEQIQVGDEVNAPFGKAIVVNIDSVAEKIWLVYADGHGGFEYFKDAPTKTGRHFPEIAEVLQKMKETDNG